MVVINSSIPFSGIINTHLSAHAVKTRTPPLILIGLFILLILSAGCMAPDNPRAVFVVEGLSHDNLKNRLYIETDRGIVLSYDSVFYNSAKMYYDILKVGYTIEVEIKPDHVKGSHAHYRIIKFITINGVEQ